jgi:hypothetical protein
MVTPHTHPNARHVTVLAGEVYSGMGDTVNEKTSKRFPAGSFFVVPAGHVHYSRAKDGEVTYQESGIGPTSLPQEIAPIAIGGKPDMARAAQFGREWTQSGHSCRAPINL